ncbi:hypothetical protein [Halomicrococcus sp. NG-SE-24]|uniref:hypothetical protein n=1 Tax=Halomicrococcus sp. NG-SE-24 TaxID=3436928 RepID=UPI003D9652A5
MTGGVPTPLDPRDPSGLVQKLTPGDRVRITTTERPRTILTVADTTSTPFGGRLVLSVPPTTTTAHQQAQHAHYHCTPADSDSSTMTVTEYPSSDAPPTCIGTLTTIARLPRLSTPPTDDAPTPTASEVSANE